jgi:hypothetical protein
MRPPSEAAGRRAASRWFTRVVGGTACVLAAACTQVVVPHLAPARPAALQPPVAARAIVLITPEFAGQQARSDDDGPPVPTASEYRLGQAAESLVVAWARASFREAEVRRLPAAEALRLFVAPRGADSAAVLLLPRFEGRLGEPYEGRRFAVRLRMDARSPRTGGVWSWAAEGRGRGAFFGPAGLASGRALVAAVGALRDSAAVHRGAL